MRRILWLAPVLVALALVPAVAQAATSGGTSSYQRCRNTIANKDGMGYLAANQVCHGALVPSQAVTTTLDAIDQGSFDIASRVRKYIYGGKLPAAYSGGAPTLFGAAILFLFVWYGYQIIFVSSDDRKGTTYLISTLLKAILFGAILTWIMYSYIPVMKQVDAGFNWLASVFEASGAAPSTQGGLGAYITSGVQSFVGVTVAFFHVRPSFPTDVGVTNLGPVLTWLLDMIVWFIPMALLFFEMILFAGFGILAQVLFAIGIAFGPLMLVLSILPFARKLAASWGNFLISAGFYKLVLAAIIGISGSVFLQSIQLLTDLQNRLIKLNPQNAQHPSAVIAIKVGDGSLLYEFLILCVVTLLLFALIMAMFSASRIANHLITGFGTFDIGTAGTGRGANVGGGGGGNNPGGEGQSGGGEQGVSPTQTLAAGAAEDDTKEKTKTGGEGERKEAPTATVDDNETPVGEGETAPGAEDEDGGTAGVGAEDDAAAADAAPEDGPGGGQVEDSGDPGSSGSTVGGDAPEASGGDSTPPADYASEDEGLPTSDEEPPPPDDSEIPPESDDETRDPTV